MNPQDQLNGEERFDLFLRQSLQATETYLPDEGFTAGVMQTLPKKSNKREWLVIGSVCIPVCALVLSQFPLQAAVQSVWQFATNPDFQTLLPTAAVVSGTLLTALGCWLARQMQII